MLSRKELKANKSKISRRYFPCLSGVVLCVILVCFQGAFKGCLLSPLPRNEMLIDNHSKDFRAVANVDIDINIIEIQRLLASVIYWMLL